MGGANGGALDWALALLQAPAGRHALRKQPLPEGMARLLGVAADVAADMQDAVQTYGMPPARLREAARFYVREVLFHAQSDAYRTLGLAPDADAAQLKAHHRLLQRWLHPDRGQSEDDVVFAARVNAAWEQIRTVERRMAYDALRLQSGVQEEPVRADASVRGHVALVATPFAAPGPKRWWGRLLVIGSGLACVVLAVLAVRDMRDGRDVAVHVEATGARTPAVALPLGSLAMDAPLPEPAKKAPSGQDVQAVATQGPASSPPLTALPVPVPSPETKRIEATPGRPMAADLPVSALAPAPAVVPARPAIVSTVPKRKSQPGLASAVSDNLAQSATLMQASANALVPDTQAQGGMEPDAVRVRKALAAGDALLGYMAVRERPSPPIWGSPGIQVSAGQLRDLLHGKGPLELGSPQWRIGQGAAAMRVAYRQSAGAEGGAMGRLVADLVWRDGLWLVTGVSQEDMH